MPTYFFSEYIFVLWYIRIVQEVLAFIFIVSAFLSSSVDFFQQNALSVLIPGVGRVGVKDLQYEYLEVSKLQSWASLVTQMVKNLPAVQETQVQSLDWEDLLKKGLATHTVFLPGEFHGQRSLVDCSPWSRKESDVIERLNTHTHIKVYRCCSM